jgi:hypothetical protein
VQSNCAALQIGISVWDFRFSRRLVFLDVGPCSLQALNREEGSDTSLQNMANHLQDYTAWQYEDNRHFQRREIVKSHLFTRLTLCSEEQEDMKVAHTTTVSFCILPTPIIQCILPSDVT